MTELSKWLSARAETPEYMPAVDRQKLSEAAVRLRFDLGDFQLRQGEWAAKTFGDQTTEEKLRHMHKEIDEIIADQGDVTEYADALSLLIDAARLQGITANGIIQAAIKKLAVNKTRTWTRNPDGTYSGSKSTDARQQE